MDEKTRKKKIQQKMQVRSDIYFYDLYFYDIYFNSVNCTENGEDSKSSLKHLRVCVCVLTRRDGELRNETSPV